MAAGTREGSEVIEDPDAIDVSEPFGAWLLDQTSQDGWIGELAKAAKADRGFPRTGDADAVRSHLSAKQAESDMFEAVDDAERLWLGL